MSSQTAQATESRKSNGKPKGKSKAKANAKVSSADVDADADADADPEASDEKMKTTMTIGQARPAPPYFWPVTRQLIWLAMGMVLPENVQNFPKMRYESVATPPNVDIATITIPLTAKELLTFFPRHTNNCHLQDRFIRNGVMGADQAATINLQRGLHPPDIVTGDNVRNHIKRARTKFPQTDPPTPCTVYTVSHWAASPTNRDQYDSVPIDYPLIDCGFGVNADKYPQGQDCGPFTRAVVVALSKGRGDVNLSGIDAFLESEGISRDLEADYSDETFVKEHKAVLAKYKATLRGEAGAKGLRWDW